MMIAQHLLAMLGVSR